MIRKITWNGISALELKAGGYTALLVPEVGANLVRLGHDVTGVEILRTPKEDEMTRFSDCPQIFGLPLLFPPNRIEDGTYTYGGRTYQYPITIPVQNNHNHGTIKSVPFVVTRTEDGEQELFVEATYFSNLFNDAVHGYFPHDFECRMGFRLSSKGLEHTVTFVNQGGDRMPLGVGYHTPINVPFTADSKAEDYRLRLSAGKRWELDGRMLPTGNLLPLEGDLALLRSEEGMKPVGTGMEFAVTAEPIEVDGRPYSGAVMTDTRTGRRVFYEVDDQVTYWTFWNNGGGVPWACPEPQTWATNAPNLNLPKEETGFRAVAPGDSWRMTSKLYVK